MFLACLFDVRLMGIITFVLIDFQAANSWIGACVHSSVIVA